jgi:hypothetical protein
MRTALCFLLLISLGTAGEPVKKIVDFEVNEGISDKPSQDVIDYKVTFSDKTVVEIKRVYEKAKEPDLFDKDSSLLYTGLYLEYQRLESEILLAELEDVLLEAKEVADKEPFRKEIKIQPPVGRRNLIDRTIDKVMGK